MKRVFKRSAAVIVIFAILLANVFAVLAEEGDPELIWVRGFFEGVGAEVLWDAEDGSITVVSGEDIIVLHTSYPVAVINGGLLMLQNDIILLNNRSYITAEDMEAVLTFGADLGYLGKTVRDTTAITGMLMEMLSVPGVTVAVVDAEEGFTWTQGFGYACTEDEIGVDEFTLFALASISKSFTAVAVMQLAEAGLIDLDEPVVTYLPDFEMPSDLTGEGDFNNITARMLLAHASGISESISGLGVLTVEEYNPGFMNNFLKYMTWFEMSYPEATRFSYANNSFTLLGILVAALMEYEDYFEGFVDYAQEFIFGPAGMELTTFMLEERHLPYLAMSYMDADTRAEHIYFNALPAGGVLSNAHDMAIFMHTVLSGGAFEGNEMLTAGSVELMFEKQDFGFEDAPDFMISMRPGLGFIYDTGIDGFEHSGHEGNLIHFHSSMMFDLDSGIGVFVSANSVTGMYLVRDLAAMILQLAVVEKTGELNVPETDSNVAEADLSEEELAVFEGFYVFAGNPGMVIIAVEDGILTMSNAFGSPEPLALVPLSDGSFSLSGIQLRVWIEEFYGEMTVFLGEFKSVMIGGRLEPELLEYILAEEWFEDWAGTYEAVDEGNHVSLMTRAVTGIDENGFMFIRMYTLREDSAYSPLIHLGDGYFLGGILLFEDDDGDKRLAFSGIEMIKAE